MIEMTTSDEKESVAQTLLRMASRARLLRGVDGRFYATVPVGERSECLKLRSPRFARWLTRAYRQAGRLIPPAEALKGVVALLEADAEHDGAIETAFLRVGLPSRDAGSTENSTHYIDLGDRSFRGVKIGPGHWTVVDRPPVHFLRPDGFRALPTPSRDASIEVLKQYVNVAPSDFLMLIAWMTAALCPVGPYPLLVLTGEQGSAKSTLARIARLLIDPHSSPLRGEPESRRDLMIGAVNNWLLVIDNLSAIPGWLWDGLCQLATGGSFAARRLYQDDQEHHVSACRPVLLTGIGNLARRGDLVDRSLFLSLPPIPDSRRQYEKDLWTAFEADYPGLFGALLEAVTGGLKKLPEIQLESRPRMADFARWGESVSQALGQPPDAFLSAYRDNRQGASLCALDDSPVGRAVLQLLSSMPLWSGTATELLAELTRGSRDPIIAVKRWPRSAMWLSDHLRRAAPGLRVLGVTVTFGRNLNSRLITIHRSESQIRNRNWLESPGLRPANEFAAVPQLKGT
jgi:hypothetical protein